MYNFVTNKTVPLSLELRSYAGISCLLTHAIPGHPQYPFHGRVMDFVTTDEEGEGVFVQVPIAWSWEGIPSTNRKEHCIPIDYVTLLIAEKMKDLDIVLTKLTKDYL